ncbi:GpE family phage tail protein [Novosphingobium sp. CF614]
MATIAAVFHWEPQVMDDMTLSEMIDWYGLAVDRWNQMWGRRSEGP